MSTHWSVVSDLVLAQARSCSVRRLLGVVAVILLFLATECGAARAAPPSNDNYGNRLLITLGGTMSVSNLDATVESNEPLTANDPAHATCIAGHSGGAGGVVMARTLWWDFTGNGGRVTVSSAGSSLDTVLAVYDTTGVALLGCDDDVGSSSTGDDPRATSELTVNTVAGHHYAVQLGGCDPANSTCAPITTGTAVLRVSPTPANDTRDAATPIALSSVVTTGNYGALTDPGETTACGASRYSKTVWYRFSVPTTGTVRITVFGFETVVDTVLALYKAGQSAPLACNDDAFSGWTGGSSLPATQPAGPLITVAPGDYDVQVGGFYDTGLAENAGRSGPFKLQVAFTASDDADGDRFPASVDCNDGEPAIHPGAVEIPNNAVDENCDGITAQDADGDNYLAPPAGQDCNDGDQSIHPAATEVAGDGIDQDCDGKDAAVVVPANPDRDGDGVLNGFDCAPDDSSTHAGATDTPDDGVDQDCDGKDAINADPDGDLVMAPYDCAPRNAAIHPGATDIAGDKVDQDCNGSDALPSQLHSLISFAFNSNGVARTAIVSSVVAGTKISVKCIGKDCPYPSSASTTVSGPHPRVSLLGKIPRKLLTLRGKDKLQVSVTAPGFYGVRRVFQRGKTTAPNYCLRPKAVRCPPT
jgi:hypothetical protein